jgi:UDP-3-O-[3-hydroxymyristoyl] N-acetylglucosamine deacetylase
VTLTLHPADANTGIQFQRTDIPGFKTVKADALTVGTTENATTIGAGREAIHTVEHLLSAFYGLGIDNAYVELNGAEIPIMDGSAASFIFLLKEIGIKNLTHSKKFMVIKKKVEWKKTENGQRSNHRLI